jgi:DNA-directed RNA polymerase specialized sigma24 family protein
MEQANSSSEKISIDFDELEKLVKAATRRPMFKKFSEDDIDELRQNVVVAALEQKNEWQKQLQEIVWNEAMSLFDKKFSARKRKHDVRSLTEIDTLQLVFNDPPTGEPDMFEQIFLSEQIQDVIDALPPHQQELCELLKHYSVAEVCKRLRLKHDSELRRLCEALRPAFIAAGIF